MSERPAADWDPRSDAVLADQLGAYDTMRESCPVAHSEFLNWSVFRHADIVDILSDPETFSSATRRRAIPNGMDAPEHTLYRQVLEPLFTPEHVAEFEEDFQDIAANLLGNLSGEVDYVAEFAEPYSLMSHCVFVGWDMTTWERLRGWTHGNLQAAFTRDREAGKSLAEIYEGFVTEEISQRWEIEEYLPIDVTSRLMTAEVNGKRLTEADIVSILRNWTAGHGTVAAGISIIAWHLAQDPALQATLRAQPERIATAVDEILRADGPLVSNRRTTTRTVELGGRSIGPGENLTLMWMAANRDPQAFEDPTTIDVERDQTGNLVFGYGIHDCVGAPLARSMMQTALRELLARCKTIELVPGGEVVRSVYPSNGFQKLTLRLG